MRWILLFPLFGCLSVYADVTGQWNGSARFHEGGKEKQSSISMTLVQKGNEVTGSVLVENKNWQITAGRNDDGGRVRFRVNVPNDEVQFDLTITGDRMSGKATSAKGSEGEAVVELTRKVLALPAIDASGVWTGTMSGKGENLPAVLEFHQSGNEVLGTITLSNRAAPFRGEMDGAKLTLHAEESGEKVRFALIVTRETMSGFAGVEGKGKDAVFDVELMRSAKPTAASKSGVSGQWIGTVDVDQQGTVKHYTVRFRLAQSRNTVSGSLVNDDGAEFAIQTGSVEGNRVEFEMDAKGEHVRFRLTLDGDKLTGESIQSRGGTQTSARITAVRRIE